MSRNGSGVYSPPVNSWNPAVSGNAATPADWQSILNDISAALTQSLSADGQTQLTGNLNANGNKLTNLGAGSASGDTLSYQQLFSQGTEQDVASSATTDIGVINSNFLRITGTTTITSFGTNYNGPRFLRFASALTLTHSASLVLPGNQNINVNSGDSCIVVPIGNPSNGWRVAAYLPALVMQIFGTAARITADFSNATLANRAMFQTSTTNAATSISALPNGTSTQSDFAAYGGTDPANSPITVIRNTGTEAQILATRSGTGAFVPFTVYVGGAEKLRQNINAQFGIQASPNTGWGASIPALQLSNATTCYQINGVSVFANNAYNDGTNAKLLTAAAASALVMSGDSVTINNYSSGSANSVVSQIASFGLDGVGNATLRTASGGLGYGTGAGGTVTQATSKTTSVTLNKPTGKITMNNAALAAGASVSFVVNNSLFNETDLVIPSPVNNSNYEVRSVNSTNGAFRLRVTNTTGGSLSEAVEIQFSIFKGATS